MPDSGRPLTRQPALVPSGPEPVPVSAFGNDQAQGLLALAERCEKAAGPDRQIDHAIADAIGDWINLGGWWRRHKVTGEREQFTYSPAPECTADLNAAMSLVPVNTRLRGFGEGKSGIWTADIVERDRSLRCLAIGSGATPALALCAAALRARAATQPKDPTP